MADIDNSGLVASPAALAVVAALASLAVLASPAVLAVLAAPAGYPRNCLCNALQMDICQGFLPILPFSLPDIHKNVSPRPFFWISGKSDTLPLEQSKLSGFVYLQIQ